MIDFPKTEKIEFRLRQDLANRLPRDKRERNAFLNAAVASKLEDMEQEGSITNSEKVTAIDKKM